MTDPLFRRADLGAVFDRQEQALSSEVDSLSEDQILNTSPDELCDYLVDKYRIDVPEIDESGIKVDYGDAQIDEPTGLNIWCLTGAVPLMWEAPGSLSTCHS